MQRLHAAEHITRFVSEGSPLSNILSDKEGMKDEFHVLLTPLHQIGFILAGIRKDERIVRAFLLILIVIV